MASLPSAKTVRDSNPHFVRCNDVFFSTLNYITPIKKMGVDTLVKHPSVVNILIRRISGYAPYTREYGYQHGSYHLC